jgi:hypothetical protein
MTLRRFTTHAKPGNPTILPEDHPAVVEGRSRFKKSANANRGTGKVLISGINQRKIGAKVQKGAWKGFPIYTLTLEERKTCPRSCTVWASCYGNNMPWSIRHPADETLIDKLSVELQALQDRYPQGFVIRLHILGDFFSVAYVQKWRSWLDQFPALNVFGYTARRGTDPIGAALRDLILEQWDRFAIRSSGSGLFMIPAAAVVKNVDEVKDGILCPAQTDKTACCATCAFCWSSPKAVVFLQH